MGHMSVTRAVRVVVAAAVTAAGTGIAACGSSNESAGTVDSAGMATAAGDSTTGVPAQPAQPDAPAQSVLAELAALGGKPIETLTPAEARRQPTPTDAVKQLLAKNGQSAAPAAGVTVANRSVAGAAGNLPANIYTPDGAGPFPVIVYYHGGGWVIGSKDVYDGGARALSMMANAVVVSANYRKGPENKFPAAHDDAVAIYEWASRNAASIKGDPTRLALAGESAGGGLAVATAIAARDRKLPAPLAIVSVYPIAGTDTTTPSYTTYAAAKPLSRPMMSWFFEHYLRSPADRQDPRINLVAANLQGLPPTTIINAQIDPLLSDGEMLAQKLKAAGVSVTQKTYDGVPHEFFGMGVVHDKAKEANGMAADALKKAFER